LRVEQTRPSCSKVERTGRIVPCRTASPLQPLPRTGQSQCCPTAKTATQKALEKLGLKRDIDLALHLPLRYEDETRITKLRDAREGDTVQIEGPGDGLARSAFGPGAN
jgi:hypothetical protein